MQGTTRFWIVGILICGLCATASAEPAAHGAPATCVLSTAQHHLDAGRIQSAFQVLRHAIGSRPADADIRLHLGIAYRRSGDYVEARKHVRMALQVRDKDRLWLARCYTELARCWELEGDSEEAIMAYRLALGAHPGYRDAEFGIGRATAHRNEDESSTRN